MMSSGESFPASGLVETHYPNVLRTDSAAQNFVDGDGNTYLKPKDETESEYKYEHDYAMTQTLIDAGLTAATVVEFPDYQPMVRFDRNTDLIPLTSVLNSSLSFESPDNIDDVQLAIYLIALTLKELADDAQIMPADCNMSMWAIDRANSRAELLPPYQAMPVRPGQDSPLLAIDQLKADILRDCQAPTLCDTVEEIFTEALKDLRYTL